MNAGPLPYADAATRASSHEARDECCRCGYNLLGIDNEQPCPECGLLAERSRRITDELHNTRPRWLRSLAIGIRLILYALLVFAISETLGYLVDQLRFMPRSRGDASGLQLVINVVNAKSKLWAIVLSYVDFVAPILFLIGVWMLTVPEKYPPADHADRKLRVALRIVATAPLLWMLDSVEVLRLGPILLRYLPMGISITVGQLLAYLLFYALPIPLLIAIFSTPFLLFERLRGLAKRARSAHLVEHCRIVGITMTLAIVYIAAAGWLLNRADDIVSTNWARHSMIALFLFVLLLTVAILFVLWSLYLLIRFALSFRRAARMLNERWNAADHARMNTA